MNTVYRREAMVVDQFSKHGRMLYIDVMRILAAFFVIFNHSGGYFMFPQYVSDPPRYWGYLFLSVFTKFAVPLFFAISGALLLNRPQEPLRKIWFGRIFKFALILFLARCMPTFPISAFSGIPVF